MNFFGHVAVAAWRSSSPAMALGSMLPDFASMCRGRLVRAVDAEVARGIELHHHTDAVFHRLPGFIELYRDTTARLRERGVRRGGARGTAHVAVELLLDGLLVTDESAAAMYLAALELSDRSTDGSGDSDAGPERVLWAEPDHAMRWDHLRARLRAHGLPVGYRDPDIVAERITMILSRHSMLALSPDEAEMVRAEMSPLRDRVAAAAPAIIAAVRE